MFSSLFLSDYNISATTTPTVVHSFLLLFSTDIFIHVNINGSKWMKPIKTLLLSLYRLSMSVWKNRLH